MSEKSYINRRNLLKGMSTSVIVPPANANVLHNFAQTPEVGKRLTEFVDVHLTAVDYPETVPTDTACRLLPKYTFSNGRLFVSRANPRLREYDTLVGHNRTIMGLDQDAEVRFNSIPTSMGKTSMTCLAGDATIPPIEIEKADAGYTVSFGGVSELLTAGSTYSTTRTVEFASPKSDEVTTVDLQATVHHMGMKETIIHEEKQVFPLNNAVKTRIQSMINSDNTTESLIEVFENKGIVAIDPSAFGRTGRTAELDEITGEGA